MTAWSALIAGAALGHERRVLLRRTRVARVQSWSHPGTREAASNTGARDQPRATDTHVLYYFYVYYFYVYYYC